MSQPFSIKFNTMNKYYVYVLYSASADIFYIGQTMSVAIRLDEHLQHFKDVAFTKRAVDWIVFYQLEAANRSQALLIEQHIKRMKSRTYLENLKKYPEISTRLLEKYQ